MINHVYGLAVRVFLTDENGKILILKRSTDSKTNPGKWELPGGKVDQDESFDHALTREVYEETKLKIALDHVVGAAEQNLHIIRAVHIIMSGNVVEGELTLSSEHEGYAWVYSKNLSNYELADWLEDYITNKNNILDQGKRDGKQENKTTEDAKNILKPWVNSIKDSMDKIVKKK
ncbi:NUDIX hydrolase [Methanobacterium paludis]|uniref:NUDIX hydrolase n=1 Tax=Methanobacterium paludis (strain DSM 25820 / JCM 18151 / SWAN1) TaxID=868131 RepID=F6D5N5_METPW|nr:NUDIX domain-containing protein [Methanobacterium paludis]AEG17652.1 NUDIX hydrolase [Methanobacterium paludis]